MLETDELRIRVASVRLGASSTLVLALIGLAYYADTWNAPNRPVMAVLAAACAALLLALPVARIVSGRIRDVFFVGWSAASTLGIALFFHLDAADRLPQPARAGGARRACVADRGLVAAGEDDHDRRAATCLADDLDTAVDLERVADARGARRCTRARASRSATTRRGSWRRAAAGGWAGAPCSG